MRKIIVGLLLLLRTCAPAYAEDIGSNTVCFVPGPDDCALVAVAEINKATKTLDVEQFQLTEPRVAQALIDAHNRGVAVRLIVDKKAPGERNGQTLAISGAGIPVWVDFKPHIAHNKVIVIDQAVEISGSFNMTTNADVFNAENLVVMRDSAFAQAYEKNFEDRLEQSVSLADYKAAHSN